MNQGLTVNVVFIEFKTEASYLPTDFFRNTKNIFTLTMRTSSRFKWRLTKVSKRALNLTISM